MRVPCVLKTRSFKSLKPPLASWQDKSDELTKQLIVALVSASLEQQRNDTKVLSLLAGA